MWPLQATNFKLQLHSGFVFFGHSGNSEFLFPSKCVPSAHRINRLFAKDRLRNFEASSQEALLRRSSGLDRPEVQPSQRGSRPIRVSRWRTFGFFNRICLEMHLRAF